MTSQPRRFGPAIWATATLSGALVMLLGAGVSWSQTAARTIDPAQIAALGVVAQGTPACASCHGFRGEGVQAQNGPRLAGLDADYLGRQLDAFASGQRRSVAMTPVARTLTPDQREALAAYYASLAPTAEAAAGGRVTALGRSIALRGDWSEKVPPCASCHGADGLGVGSFTPPLAGQRADYLVRQLTAFRGADRHSDAIGLMRGISARMSPAEIRAVAAYYASLPPKPGSSK